MTLSERLAMWNKKYAAQVRSLKVAYMEIRKHEYRAKKYRCRFHAAQVKRCVEKEVRVILSRMEETEKMQHYLKWKMKHQRIGRPVSASYIPPWTVF